MHGLRNRRQLGMLRALWQARDEMARRRDVAPGRVLPDSAMVSAVQADPANEGALLELPVFRGRANRKLVAHWFGAMARGRALPEAELPPHSRTGDGPPRSTDGPTGTRRPRPGCRRRGPGWPSCPRSTPSRWRTCSPPTWSGG